MYRKEDTILHGVLLSTDLVGVILSIIIAFAIRYQRFLGILQDGDSLWIVAILLIVTALIDVFVSPVGNYITRGIFAEITDVFVRQLISIGGMILLLYLAHRADELSRLVFGYYLIISIVILWLTRLMIKKYLTKYYKSNESAIRLTVIANQDRIPRMVDRISRSNEWKRIITKTIAIDIDGYDKALEYIVRNEVDEALISITDIADAAEYQDFISKLIGMGIKVDIDINQFEMDVPGRKTLDEIGKYAVVSISKGNLKLSQQFIKRFFDIIFGLIGFVVFAITFVIVGPLI